MKQRLSIMLLLVLFTMAAMPSKASAARQMENLGRGVVAVRASSSSVFISWRLLGLDPSNIGFNIYRAANGGSAVKLNGSTLTGGTNFTDSTADFSRDNAYFVKPVIGGNERDASGSFTLTANHAIEPVVAIPLRSGAEIHFAWVGDLDGDGEYDYVIDRMDWTNSACKIEAYKRDGTFLWDVDYGTGLNMDNISPGPTVIDTGQWDGVTVYDVNGDGKAEVITKVANGVRLGDGTVWSDSNPNKQSIAVLDGTTGALIASAPIPTDFLSVGPLASLLGIGYLDGKTPSIIAYMKNRNPNKSFNRMTCAYHMENGSLSLQWKWAGAGGGADGHSIRILDVNGDGIDYICNIGYVLDGKDGSMLYNLDSQGIVHGDRFQIGKFDKDRAGLQGYGIQQDNPSFMTEYYYDASTGEVLWKHYTTQTTDTARGSAADIDPNYPGYEVWSFFGLYNGPSNTLLGSTNPYPNFRLWWDGDVLGENYNDGKIEKYNYATATISRLLTTWHYHEAGGSARGAPLFYGDIMGDWREEVVLTNADYSELVVFTTPTPSDVRLYTLAQNPEYRNSMTIKGYMQSHYVDYYLGAGMSDPPTPDISYVGVKPEISAAGNWLLYP